MEKVVFSVVASDETEDSTEFQGPNCAAHIYSVACFASARRIDSSTSHGMGSPSGGHAMFQKRWPPAQTGHGKAGATISGNRWKPQVPTADSSA
jgi:hypothetical protein